MRQDLNEPRLLCPLSQRRNRVDPAEGAEGTTTSADCANRCDSVPPPPVEPRSVLKPREENVASFGAFDQVILPIKSVPRKLVERVLLCLGDATSQSSRAQSRVGDGRDAQRLAGDERDAKMIANLRENFKDAPKFLTVPISEWYAPRFFFVLSSWLFSRVPAD